MREGILQRPAKFQLTFQIQQGLLILLPPWNGALQHLSDGDSELSNTRRNPIFRYRQTVAREFFSISSASFTNGRLCSGDGVLI